jgi:hypothetical protein
MDVDNGPEAVMFPGNGDLYTPAGLRLMLSGLRPGGILALWAADPSANFEAVLASVGVGELTSVPVHGTGGAVQHFIYLVHTDGFGNDASARRVGHAE